MIPKLIHYCWFGRKPLPKSAKKCIASWKKYFPNYEIVEWNEDNYDVNKISYIQQAYDAKKYAFVSDYARFDILYHEGGIYFDTDVEVIRSFDDILENGSFMGCEIDGRAVNPGLGMAAESGLHLYKEILDFYSTQQFLNKDGSFNTETVVTKTTKLLLQHGMKQEKGIQSVEGIMIYPEEYFNPMNNNTGKLVVTKNTHSIHWYSMSWINKKSRLRSKITRPIHRLLGEDCFRCLKVGEIKNRMPNGIHWRRIKYLKSWKNMDEKIIRDYLNYLKFKYLHGYGKKYEKELSVDIVDGYMNICGVSFPYIKTSDLDTFFLEFPDMIFPYILEHVGKYDRKDAEMFYLEGPYCLNEYVCVNPGDVVIDCGANMGMFSAFEAKEAQKIYAFEPDPTVIGDYLKKTAIETPTIEIVNAALGSTEGVANFESCIDNRGAGRLSENRTEKSFDVRVTTLDSFVEENGIEKIDFIKADIEGAEREMLRGAKKVLKEMAPKLAICTYHLPDDKEVLERLVLDANPNYVIEHKYLKMYAYVK